MSAPYFPPVHEIYQWTGAGFFDDPETGDHNQEPAAGIGFDLGPSLGVKFSNAFLLADRARGEDPIGNIDLLLNEVAGHGDAASEGRYRGTDGINEFDVIVRASIFMMHRTGNPRGATRAPVDAEITTADGFIEPDIVPRLSIIKPRSESIFKASDRLPMAGIVTIRPIESYQSGHEVGVRFYEQRGLRGRLHSVTRTQGSPLPSSPKRIISVVTSALESIGNVDPISNLTGLERLSETKTQRETIKKLRQVATLTGGFDGNLLEGVATVSDYVLSFVKKQGQTGAWTLEQGLVRLEDRTKPEGEGRVVDYGIYQSDSAAIEFLQNETTTNSIGPLKRQPITSDALVALDFLLEHYLDSR